MANKKSNDRFARSLFIISLLWIVFGYGFMVGRYKIFPYKLFTLAAKGYKETRNQQLLSESRPWWYKNPVKPRTKAIRNTSSAFEGLNLVTMFDLNNSLSAVIMTMDGKILHKWELDFFSLWPKPDHVPELFRPHSKPGTSIHGAVIMDDGDLVFNFDHMGLSRIDLDGEIEWQLPYRTHHSVHRHTDGTLWVCGQKAMYDWDPRFPDLQPPFDDYTILQVSPQGELLKEWSILDILHENDKHGLLSIGTNHKHPSVFKDFLHLNDVEPFPTTLQEGFFKVGDILVSLRNISTIFVFNRYTNKIKYISTGSFIWQHDPDFIDGNTISVFDNHRVLDHTRPPASRIVLLSATELYSTIYYQGTEQDHFYTDIMGKHQWLENGNLLITESMLGRAFEINRDNEIVWEYYNYLDEKTLGVIQEVQRIPQDMEPILTRPKKGRTDE